MPRLAALGRLILLGERGPLTGSAAQGRNLALLALLVRTGDAGMSREKVAAYLWPESDPERARHSLSQAVYVLRRELGEHVLVTSPTVLALTPAAITSDVGDFDRALERGDRAGAVACYVGPFLDGFHLSDAGEFERWVDGERAQLHRAWVAALEELAADAERRGEARTAVDLRRRVAAAEPLSSRAALGLMKALDRAGDRTGALQVANQHADLVRDELGVHPDPSVIEFARELRRAPERAPAPTPAHAAPRIPRTPEVANPTVPSREPADAVPWGRRVLGRRPLRIVVAVILGAALLGSVGTLLSRETGSPPDRRPAVAVLPFENSTGDPGLDALGRMAADWITKGLVETGLVRVTDPQSPNGAQSLVSGRIYRTGDSLWIQARVTRSRDGQILRAPEVVAVAAPDPSSAVEPLRQRVLGALGTLYDDRLSAFTAADTHPPPYAAYREFAAGVEQMAFPRNLPAAREHFSLASELDRTYLLPRLWLAWTSFMADDYARADSLTGALSADRDRMSVLERAWLDRMRAILAGDNEASFMAAQRMVRASPGTGWVIALANAALDTNRPSITVSSLTSTGVESLGTEAGYGWFLLTAAYHQLGEYRRELAATEQAVKTHGLRWGFVGPGVPALAALGRLDALTRRLDELRHAPPLENDRPAGPASLLIAAMELRAHGYADDAEAMVDRRLPEEIAANDRDRAEHAREWRIELLYEMGRWKEATLQLDAAPGNTVGDEFALTMRGLLAARRGDTAEARRVARKLGASDQPYMFGANTLGRARIAAVLGKADDAMSLLREAFAQGQGAGTWYELHLSRDFDGLRNRNDFRELTRPAP